MGLIDIRTCPTYVINLDRRPDRWKAVSSQPALNQFKHLERFSAVDGKTLSLYNDDRISLHTRENIKLNYRRSHYEINTAGAIGASLSHITIWQKFLESNDEYLVVFEDDTIVDTHTLNVIDKLIPTLPEGQWDMWLLGTHRWGLDGKPLLKGDLKHWWVVSNFTGAHAYVLSRQGAKVLLDTPFPIETHIEYYITNCAKFKGLRLLKHWALRMTYSAEKTEIDDSDTLLQRQTCPLCAIPDHPIKYGMYLYYDQMAILLAIGFAGVGLWAGLNKFSTNR